MGLLDKVDNLDEKKPAKAAKAKAAKPAPKKAVRKASPKPMKAAKAAKAVAVDAEQPVVQKIRPTGLPEGYELAGKMPRYIGWLINFGWNFGVLIGTISVFMFGDPDMTLPFLAAAIMILMNWLVIPIWLGRNIGEFVSRTKYINSAGNKPLFIHAVMNNSLGFMFLIGFITIFVQFQNLSSTNGMTYFGIGMLFMIIWVVNFFFKKNSDYSQGIFDLAFRAYLVKHVATGEETGWMARFEGLGDFGAKWEQRQVDRADKAAAKAEARKAAAEDSANDAEEVEPEEVEEAEVEA